MSFGLLELALQAMLAIHAGRTGRLQPWLYIIMIPGLGPLLYIVVELVPEWLRGYGGQKATAQLGRVLAPGRAYRDLFRKVEIAPTVHNKIHLAEECLNLGRATEALALYESCATGMYVNDPAVRQGLARARFAANDFDGAITELDRLRHNTPEARNPEGHLLYARALEAAGRTQEALAEYHALSDYYPGEEARCRYADLLAHAGQPDLAREQYREIIRRVDLQGNVYRRPQRTWYDTARKAVA